MTGDITVNADLTILKNLQVNGTIYINPGSTGTVTLTNVNATNIVVLSGAHNSIKFKNVKADNLTVNAAAGVRIKSDAATNIYNTSVESGAILEVAKGGKLGAIVLAPTLPGDIRLAGDFAGSTITVPSGTTVDKLVVDADATGVAIQNDGNISDVESNSTEGVIVTGNTADRTTGNGAVASGPDELTFAIAALGAKDYVYAPAYNYSYKGLDIANNVATLTFDLAEVTKTPEILMNDMARYLGALHRVDDGATIKSIEYGGKNYTWDGTLKGSNWKNGASLVGIITAQFKANPTTFDTIALTLKDADGNSAALTLKFVAN